MSRFNIPEIRVSEVELKRTAQKYNADDKIKRLSGEVSDKLSAAYIRSTNLDTTEPFIDFNNTCPETIERLNAVIDTLWENNAEPDSILFQLAFKAVMAKDICSGRERMNLFKRILSISGL